MSIVDEPSGWEHKFNYGNLRMYNNRHLKEHRRITRHFKDKTYIHNYGVQPTSIEQVDGIEEEIPEMVPEIDLSRTCPTEPKKSHKSNLLLKTYLMLCMAKKY
jgi:hypothetical protein